MKNILKLIPALLILSYSIFHTYTVRQEKNFGWVKGFILDKWGNPTTDKFIKAVSNHGSRKLKIEKDQFGHYTLYLNLNYSDLRGMKADYTKEIPQFYYYGDPVGYTTKTNIEFKIDNGPIYKYKTTQFKHIAIFPNIDKNILDELTQVNQITFSFKDDDGYDRIQVIKLKFFKKYYSWLNEY